MMLRNMSQAMKGMPSRTSSALTARPLSVPLAFTTFRPISSTRTPNVPAVPARNFSSDHDDKKVEPLNPGDYDGIIPRSIYQATGKEYKELLWRHRFGTEYYSRDAAGGHFGTMEDPALIFSNFATRVVGCLGGHTDGILKHDLMWFELSRGRKHMCSLCGQVFKLAGDWLYDTNYECYEADQKEWLKIKAKLKQERIDQLMKNDNVLFTAGIPKYTDPLEPEPAAPAAPAAPAKEQSKAH